jgi:hypothetical protein
MRDIKWTATQMVSNYSDGIDWDDKVKERRDNKLMKLLDLHGPLQNEEIWIDTSYNELPVLFIN